MAGQIKSETKSFAAEYIGSGFHCLLLGDFLSRIISLIFFPYLQKPSRVHTGPFISQHSLNIVEILSNIAHECTVAHETIHNVAAKKDSLWSHMLGDERKI